MSSNFLLAANIVAFGVGFLGHRLYYAYNENLKCNETKKNLYNAGAFAQARKIWPDVDATELSTEAKADRLFKRLLAGVDRNWTPIGLTERASSWTAENIEQLQQQYIRREQGKAYLAVYNALRRVDTGADESKSSRRYNGRNPVGFGGSLGLQGPVEMVPMHVGYEEESAPVDLPPGFNRRDDDRWPVPPPLGEISFSEKIEGAKKWIIEHSSSLGEISLLNLSLDSLMFERQIRPNTPEYHELREREAITIFPPELFSLFTGLKGIRLDHNKLFSLEGFRYPAGFETLQVACNNLSAFPDLADLPQHRISSIDFRGNQIGTIPEGLDWPYAPDALCLAKNRIETLPKDMGGIVQLASLDLEGNAIVGPAEVFFPRDLLQLNLNNNRLTQVPVLAVCDRLENLCLAGNEISDFSALEQLPNSAKFLWLDRVDALPLGFGEGRSELMIESRKYGNDR